MASVALFLVGAKLVAAAKEVAVAWRYGIGAEIDAYLLAYTVVTWVPVMVASVGAAVFVPRLVGLARGSRERERFASELNGTFVLIGSAAFVFSIVLGPPLVEFIAGELPDSTRRLAATLVVPLSPIAPLIVLASLAALRLQALERQAYTFLEAMPAVGILVFVVLAPSGSSIGPLIWGTVAGTVLQALWSARMLRGAEGSLGAVRFSHRSGNWSALYGAAGLMALGQLVLGFATPIDQYYAARSGAGAVATLGYASRVLSLAMGLGAVAIARALLPVLSEAKARGKLALGRRQALQWTSLMLGLGAAVVGLGWMLAPWVVALLFERGEFAADDTRRVVDALRIGLFQLPFFFSSIVLVQWIVALGNYRFLLLVAAGAIVVKVAFNEATVDTLGLHAVLWATTAMYAFSWALQALHVIRLHRGGTTR